MLTLPLPTGPGGLFSVGYFDPLLLTAQGNTYFFLFTHRSSCRVNKYAITGTEFTAKGTANFLIN